MTSASNRSAASAGEMGLAAKALTRSRLVSEFGLPDDAAGSGQWTLRRFWLGDRVRRSLYFRAQDRVVGPQAFATACFSGCFSRRAAPRARWSIPACVPGRRHLRPRTPPSTSRFRLAACDAQQHGPTCRRMRGVDLGAVSVLTAGHPILLVQFPRVPAPMPRSRATQRWACRSPKTIVTAPSGNSPSYFLGLAWRLLVDDASTERGVPSRRQRTGTRRSRRTRPYRPRS